MAPGVRAAIPLEPDVMRVVFGRRGAWPGHRLRRRFSGEQLSRVVG